MYDKDKELKELDNEIKIFESKNSSYQNDIAMKLSEKGLGEEIHYTLQNPVKVTKWKLFKMKFKNIINSVLDIL